MRTKKKILIVGKKNSVFSQQTARDFSTQEFDVTLVADQRARPLMAVAVEILDPINYPLPILNKLIHHILVNSVLAADYISFWIAKISYPRRYSIDEFRKSPGLSMTLKFALHLRWILRNTSFDIVYCHHAYFFGLSGVWLCSRCKVIIHPWGSDVHKYSISSPLRYTLISYVLRQADIILVGSVSVTKFISDTFSVSSKKVHTVNYTIDRSIFYAPAKPELVRLRNDLGVPLEKIVIFSCRRHAVGWGPEVIRESFIKLAKVKKDFFFIVISGQHHNRLLDEFEREVRVNDLDKCFLFFKDHIDLGKYTEISKASDYAVSAMTNPDMRSSSILQAVACGCFPILSRQPEYDEMVKEGFVYKSFAMGTDGLFNALSSIVAPPTSAVLECNSDYVDKLNKTNYVSQVDALVSK